MYQVPQHIDDNKIFVVKRSEIEGRLDPKMTLYNRKVTHSIYPKIKFKNILKAKPKYGASEQGIPRTNKNEPRYIRITDINEIGIIDYTELGVTAKIIANEYVLNYNDILIARSGATVGKAYIHKSAPYKCFYAGYLIRFIVDEQKALPDYIFAFTQLNTYKEWVNAIQRPSGQPNINAEEYQSLEIPLPGKDIQSKVVGIINCAYEAKKQKESEAQHLLDSIDGYLLNVLGITLPQITKNLRSRIFLSSFEAIAGNRFDPYYHNAYFEKAFKQLKESSNYKLVRLSDISTLITSGITPKSGGEDYTDSEQGIAFIRSGNIDIMGEVDFDNLLYIKKEIHNTRMKSSKVREGDIMIAIVGATIGQVGIYHSSHEANINQAIALVRLKEGYNSEYVKEVIKSSIGQLNLDRLKRPVARANINLEEISSMLIPVPDIKIQNEIVKSIVSIRQQAKQLQKEGVELLEKAKQDIERIILG